MRAPMPPPTGSASQNGSPRARRGVHASAAFNIPNWKQQAVTMVEADYLRDPGCKPWRGGGEAWHGGGELWLAAGAHGLLPHILRPGPPVEGAHFTIDTENFGRRRRVTMHFNPRHKRRRRRSKPAEEASRRIQRVWRAYAARLRRQRLSDLKLGALLVIRKHVLRLVRFRRRIVERRRLAAVRLQQCARRYAMREAIERKLREELLARLNGLNDLNNDLNMRLEGLSERAAMVLQAGLRAWMARRERRRLERVLRRFERHSCMRLQRAWVAQLKHRRALKREAERRARLSGEREEDDEAAAERARLRFQKLRAAVIGVQFVNATARGRRCMCANGRCHHDRGCGCAQFWELNGSQGMTALY